MYRAGSIHVHACRMCVCLCVLSKPLHTSIIESDARVFLYRHNPGSSNIPFLARWTATLDLALLLVTCSTKITLTEMFA